MMAKYQANDGRIFDTAEECVKHEVEQVLTHYLDRSSTLSGYSECEDAARVIVSGYQDVINILQPLIDHINYAKTKPANGP
jgi:hypothetical protein